MTVILDVSAAMQIILRKEKFKKFSQTHTGANWVIAPDLYIPELTNVLWKYNVAGILTHGQCQEYVKDGIDLIDDYIDTKEIWSEALGESIKQKHSAYNMFYAIVARRNDGALISNDKDLVKICRKMDIRTIS